MLFSDDYYTIDVVGLLSAFTELQEKLEDVPHILQCLTWLISEINQWYTKILTPESVPEGQRHFPHVRESLVDEKPRKLVYVAELRDENGDFIEKLIVKISKRYGAEVHASTHYLDSQRSSIMHRGTIFRDTVLSLWNTDGYVFGDLRDTNVVFRSDNLDKLLCVDFDWSGKEGEVKYPYNVESESIERLQSVKGMELITKDYEWMLELLNEDHCDHSVADWC
ncbi:hypothetical protein HK098_002307 [Nowakowskiella sp. JEL0407]|nr:hypothetical protein HK098_002307 [Nowakowskiella sp. JEL0407]